MQRLFPPAASGDQLSDAELASAIAFPDTERWIRAVFVSTLDGAAQGPDGRVASISGPPDQRFFALTRAMCDVVLVGARTARIEEYGPATIDVEHSLIRKELGYDEPPPIAIVSRSLDIHERMLADRRTIVLTTESSDAVRRKALAEQIDLVIAGDDDVDPQTAVDALTERGFRRISCEGGPLLYAELLVAGLVDDHVLTYSPLLSPTGMRITHPIPSGAPLPVRLIGLYEEEQFLFTHWERAD